MGSTHSRVDIFIDSGSGTVNITLHRHLQRVAAPDGGRQCGAESPSHRQLRSTRSVAQIYSAAAFSHGVSRTQDASGGVVAIRCAPTGGQAQKPSHIELCFGSVAVGLRGSAGHLGTK